MVLNMMSLIVEFLKTGGIIQRVSSTSSYRMRFCTFFSFLAMNFPLPFSNGKFTWSLSVCRICLSGIY